MGLRALPNKSLDLFKDFVTLASLKLVLFGQNVQGDCWIYLLEHFRFSDSVGTKEQFCKV